MICEARCFQVVDSHSQRRFPSIAAWRLPFPFPFPFRQTLLSSWIGRVTVAGSSLQGELLSKLAQYAAVTWQGDEMGAHRLRAPDWH
jgi:hypothetical protein